MKRIICIFSVILLVIVGTIGCSKDESYIVIPNNNLEVGKDIPEGIYLIEKLEGFLADEDDSSKIEIGGEDGPNAEFIHIGNSDNEEIELKDGTIITTNGKVKLTKK